MSQKIPRRQLAAIIAPQFAAAVPPAQPSRVASEIAAYLLLEHRTGELESLVRDILEYREADGVIEALATTAHDLTPALRDAIGDELERLYPDARQVIIDERRDARVLGGLRLELPNRQLDATVRGRLNRFKQLTRAGKD